jgi:hypothetical protein
VHANKKDCNGALLWKDICVTNLEEKKQNPFFQTAE